MAASPVVANDATLERLDEQITWYNRKSNSHKKYSNLLKLVTLIAGAAIPLIPALYGSEKFSRAITALLGTLVVVVEGIQQLYQLQTNWIIYRSTCEHLKHEKYLFLAGAGTYANAQNPHVLLAERIESLVSQENARWTSAQVMTPARSLNQTQELQAH